MASGSERAWNDRPRPHSPWAQPKLTTVQRQDIARRLADGERPADLALEYGVTASLIRQLR
ncbi:Hin recombinase [Streptomyces bauhiniae]|uniref:Hin recombinase n=1 Tax=Streptomyces bauhiniae TaxID=2340725 RepID=A0A7K3QR86_9ACTN|nr:Hin recombinase [Streptomyces bauhiniae]NEB92404.1 Hin recombinase [Streptomyces bauhiniae]